MASNFERYHRIRQRVGRWDRDGRFSVFHDLRRRLYRSRQGKVLGVFSGIAESMGFCVRWTRIIGCIILLTLTDFFGAHGVMVTLLVGGFFYLLTALLMQAPRDASSASASTATGYAGNPPPIPVARAGGAYPTAAPFQRPRVDLAQLDRQLDRLNLRIQRMEGIVTDRQFDWERRMES